MPATSTERTRALGAQQALAVLLGLPLHLLLVTATDDPSGMLGTRDSVTPIVVVALAAQGLCGASLWCGPAFLSWQPSLLTRLLTVALPLPLLLLMWPLAWQLATVGLLCCLAQAVYLGTVARQPVGLLFEGPDRARAEGAGDTLFGLAWRSAAGMLVLVLLVSGHGVAHTPLSWFAVCVYVVLALLINLPIEVGTWLAVQRRRVPYVQIVLGVAAVCAWFSLGWRSAILPLLGLRQTLATLALWRERGGGRQLWRRLTRNPAGLLALSFLSAIIAGALLLDLPVAAVSGGHAIGAVDALFTATSAVCVTGLAVVDTGTAFSRFGQTVILVLIQVGGLGVMTVSMFVALLAGRDLGVYNEAAIAEMIGEARNRMVRSMVWFIVLSSAGVELVGAGVLAWGFRRQGMGYLNSLYYGLFHSVSAFCNAGFALFSDSFSSYAGKPLFSLTLSALIAAGGLGFSVLYSLSSRRSRRRGVPLPPQVRLVLSCSLVLWLGGAALLWLAERHGVLAGMSWQDTLVNAWFQSVTARTAGFNTVDIAALSPVSDMLVRVLMFIGAGPGSTGGGVKVTTAAVLVLLVAARLHGRDHAVVLGRRLDEETTLNATVIAVLGLVAVLGVSALLVATQDVSATLTPGMLSFEAISAFGTVGLSQGATAQLNTFGRLAIAGLMFVGRVGPLTLLVIMRPRRRSRIGYPVARVMVG